MAMPSSGNVAVDFDIYDVFCSPFILWWMSYKEEIGPGENFKLPSPICTSLMLDNNIATNNVS